MSFFDELKRRNVFRVGIAYLVGSWLLLQIADVVLNNIAAPGWVFKAIMLLVAIGLPISLFFAWAFELTPDGVKRESEVDRSSSLRQETGQKLNRGITVILVIALAYFVWESRFHPGLAQTGSESNPQTQTDPNAQSTNEDLTLTPVEAQLNVPAETSPGQQPDVNSVAVLPFVNMSSDPEQEYFSDGITEEIINALVKIPGLSVPARTSVFGFKGHRGDVRKIGQELGVAHILEGSIRSQGNQVRITAQLIKVDDGFHLWSDTFDRKLENIFAVQEEIAMAIATVLIGELELTAITVPNQTRNMEAYDLYLQGRALLRKRDDKAVEILEQASQADPDFAPAWAALAIAYQVGDMALDEKIIPTAKIALQLDPNNVDALDAMGSVLRSKMHWQEAEGYFERALAIDPQSSELLEDYAEFLAKVGRNDEALKVTTRGYAIDANLLPLTLAHIEALLSNDQLEASLNLLEKIVIQHPEQSWLRLEGLPVYLAQTEHMPGEETLRKAGISSATLAAITSLLEEPGNTVAIATLKTLLSEEKGITSQSRIDLYAARNLLAWAGESDFVLDFELDNIHKSGFGLHEWTWTPVFKSVRQNPRYEQYLQKAGLIEYWDATAWPDWCWREENERVVCQ